MPLPVRMADSVSPWQIPTTFAKQPNGVLAYADGPYAWSAADARRFPRKRWITVARGGWDPHGAWELDVETGDATPREARTFVSMKLDVGRAACIYCDRSTVPLVRDQLLQVPGHLDETDWHIATLDGLGWTPAQINSWLQSHFGFELDPARIWAIQDQPMGTYDVSQVFGRPDWEVTA